MRKGAPLALAFALIGTTATALRVRAPGKEADGGAVFNPLYFNPFDSESVKKGIEVAGKMSETLQETLGENSQQCSKCSVDLPPCFQTEECRTAYNCIVEKEGKPEQCGEPAQPSATAEQKRRTDERNGYVQKAADLYACNAACPKVVEAAKLSQDIANKVANTKLGDLTKCGWCSTNIPVCKQLEDCKSTLACIRNDRDVLKNTGEVTACGKHDYSQNDSPFKMAMDIYKDCRDTDCGNTLHREDIREEDQACLECESAIDLCHRNYGKCNAKAYEVNCKPALSKCEARAKADGINAGQFDWDKLTQGLKRIQEKK